MATDKHYFIEQNDNGKFTTTAKGASRASGVFKTQREAIDYAKQLNPDDKPNVERVRHRSGGSPDKWRSSGS